MPAHCNFAQPIISKFPIFNRTEGENAQKKKYTATSAHDSAVWPAPCTSKNKQSGGHGDPIVR